MRYYNTCGILCKVSQILNRFDNGCDSHIPGSRYILQLRMKKTYPFTRCDLLCLWANLSFETFEVRYLPIRPCGDNNDPLYMYLQ